MNWKDKFQIRINDATFVPEVNIAGKWISFEVITAAKVAFGIDYLKEQLLSAYGQEYLDKFLKETEGYL